MKPSKLLTVTLSLLIALVLLTAAIAAPILLRPFYYAHIGPLELEAQTGLSRTQIKTAYNEMLDYCLGKSEEFSTGVLAWSESGKSHFTDVRSLFLLDLRVLAASINLLVLCAVLGLLFKRRPARLWRRGPAFWAGTGLGSLFLIVGGIAAINFDTAFVVFHSLFFPGKDNWLFDPRTDQIIHILPDVFFRNCAIFILALLLLGCAALILGDLFLKGKKRH